MTLDEAANNIGAYARVMEPRRQERHATAGRIVGVVGKKVHVHLWFHKRSEAFDPRYVRLWKSRNETTLNRIGRSDA